MKENWKDFWEAVGIALLAILVMGAVTWVVFDGREVEEPQEINLCE